MKNKRFLLLVLLVAILLSLLPIYPAVYEIRNISVGSNDELERRLVFGSMVDFVQDFRYVQKAWDEGLLPLNIFLGLLDLAICLFFAWVLSLGIHAFWGRVRKKK